MIATIKYPSKEEVAGLIKRPEQGNNAVLKSVQAILYDVAQKGDAAIRQYTELYDKTTPGNMEVPKDVWLKAAGTLDAPLKTAINTAIENIRKFHEAQREEIKQITTTDGVVCWRKPIAIDKVGLYIPGGSAPLFSTLLMLAVPAVIAGCKEIIVCTPPDKQGNIHPAILYAAAVTGVHRIFGIGGAQAIAAMGYGTESVPRVYKIFGPGNSYVTAAKVLLGASGTAIDIPAGPSEVAILADEQCIPAFVAADLLAQAEHGPDSQVLLVTNSNKVIEDVCSAIAEQLQQLPRKDTIQQALNNSKAVLVNTLAEGMDIINAYAPEHLIIATADAEQQAEQVINAGSVFIGNYTPESAGDYASGTNHTLPTGGHARAYSGVSLDSFVKKITFQKITPQGLKNLSPTITQMAMAEGLAAHAASVTIRTNALNQ